MCEKSWCTTCTKEYQKQYRIKNSEKLKLSNKEWRRNHIIEVRNRKYNTKCFLEGRIKEMLRAAKKRAKRKNIPFTLTYNFLFDMWKNQDGKCLLTKLPLIIPTNRNNGRAMPFSPSIDRIDCEKGYTEDNVRLLCYITNIALNKYGDDVFDRIAHAYINKKIMPFEIENKKVIRNAKQKWETKYREGKNGTVNFLYTKCKKRADKSKIDFNLSRNYILDLLKIEKCEITGLPIIYELEENGINPFRPSIDRIDCKKGYTEDNVRIVCVAVNYCLNEFGINLFDKIMHAYWDNKYNTLLKE